MKEVLSERRRMAIYREMLPELQAVATTMERKLCNYNRGKNLAHYDCGRHLLTMCERPDIYGDQLEVVAEYLGADVMFLCEIRNVAAVFDRDFVEQESTVPMARGTFLHIRYFIELCKLDSEEEQTALLRRIREENLSCGEVAKLVAMSPRRRKRPSQ